MMRNSLMLGMRTFNFAYYIKMWWDVLEMKEFIKEYLMRSVS